MASADRGGGESVSEWETAQALANITEQISASPEMSAVGALLAQVKAGDPELAAALIAAYSDLSVEHGKLCYTAGFEHGAHVSSQTPPGVLPLAYTC